MTPDDFKRARELRQDPDSEDNERFASWYGEELLQIAESQPALLEALSDILDLFRSVAPEYEQSTVCANARAAVAKAVQS